MFHVAEQGIHSLVLSTLQFLFFHLSIFLTFPQQRKLLSVKC
jgi:hypothetical protein